MLGFLPAGLHSGLGRGQLQPGRQDTSVTSLQGSINSHSLCLDQRANLFTTLCIVNKYTCYIRCCTSSCIQAHSDSAHLVLLHSEIIHSMQVNNICSHLTMATRPRGTPRRDRQGRNAQIERQIHLSSHANSECFDMDIPEEVRRIATDWEDEITGAGGAPGRNLERR